MGPEPDPVAVPEGHTALILLLPHRRLSDASWSYLYEFVALLLYVDHLHIIGKGKGLQSVNNLYPERVLLPWGNRFIESLMMIGPNSAKSKMKEVVSCDIIATRADSSLTFWHRMLFFENTVKNFLELPILKAFSHEKVPIKTNFATALLIEHAILETLQKSQEKRVILEVSADQNVVDALLDAVQKVAAVEYLTPKLSDTNEVECLLFAVNFYRDDKFRDNGLFVSQVKQNMIHALRKQKIAVHLQLADLRPRELQEYRDEASEAADKIVSRQYRLVSIKLHPDRYGDLYEKEFEALQTAYDILKDKDSRADFIEKMISILAAIQTMDPTQRHYILEQSYMTYLDDHLKKKDQESNNHARYQEQAGAHRAHFYLETTMFRQPPKAPHVIRVGNGSKVHVELPPLSYDTTTYQELLRSVTVHAETPFEGEDLIWILKGDALRTAFDPENFGYIRIARQLGEYGSWNFYWYASLRDPENYQSSIDTPCSSRKEFLIEDAQMIQAREQLPGIMLRIKKYLGVLRPALREISSVPFSVSSSHLPEYERKYWNLHHLISNCRSVARHFQDTVGCLGYTVNEVPVHNKEYFEFLRCVDECCTKKGELERIIQQSEKKKSINAFKHSIAMLIEGGTLADWILTVRMKELGDLGGESNRLYQLLTEGKKANSLLLDSRSLEHASLREDLFSPKQCKALKERANEVALKAAEETERMLREEAQKEEEAELRRELEERAALMPLRSFVRLHRLKNRPELNGLDGIFMGLAAGHRDRYQIRVQFEDFALKKENFYRVHDHRASSPSPNGRMGGSLASPPRQTKVLSVEQSSRAPAKASPVNHPENTDSKTKDATSTGRTTIIGPRRTREELASQGRKADINLSLKQSGDQSRGKEPDAWIPQAATSKFIGPRGANVKNLASRCGARITVDKNRVNEESCYGVYLQGRKEQVDHALDLIASFMDSFQKASLSKQRQRENKESKTITASTSSKAGSLQDLGPTPHSGVAKGVRNNKKAIDAKIPPAANGKVTSIAKISKKKERVVSTTGPKATAMDSLFLFLCQQASCFKCKPKVFYDFVKGQDITTLNDLKEATEDDDFLQEMLEAGLKGFKKAIFRKAIASAVADSEAPLGVETVDNGLHYTKRSTASRQMRELECPICFELMSTDPVIAKDGFTYERHAIEGWFQRHKDDPNGIRSPKTNMPLASLDLIPNSHVRAMAQKAGSLNKF